MPPADGLILNVDDNEIALYAKNRALRHAGLAVVNAVSGREALRLVAELAPAVVLLDIKLPDIGGMEVCRIIKRDHPGTMVLQVSASLVTISDRVRGLDSGADAYLTQPVEPEEMVAAVRALLRLFQAERALREETVRLETLNRVGAMLAAELDLARLAQAVVDAGVELVGAEFGVFVYQRSRPAEPPLHAVAGTPPAGLAPLAMARGTEVFDPVVGSVRVEDLDMIGEAAAAQHPVTPGTRSYLAVPVRSRTGEVLGGLFFGHARPAVFAPRHERLITAVAAQAAVSIDNARLYQAAQREIEERRRAEEALRESEEQFRTLAESIPQLAWMTDETGDIFWYNQRWYDFTGTTYEQVKGWGWRIVHHPDHVRRVVEHFRHCIRAGEVWEDTFPLRDRHGQYRWFLSRARPIRDARGQIVRWFGTNTDVTEQRQAEAALRDINQLLAAEVRERTRERDRIWQLSRDLLGVLTLDGYFESVNPSWQATFGWTEEELRSNRFLDFVHPGDRERTAIELERLAQGLVTQRFENRCRDRDGGYRWLSWTAVPEGGRCYCVLRDITAEKEAAEALIKAEEQLRQAQKMEAVGQLTGGVAHDFNNLLTVVIGNLETVQRLLAGPIEDPQRLTRAVENAMRGANRAVVLTQRLLAFARRQPLAPKAVDINRLVADMSDLLRRTLGEQVELVTDLASGLWLIHADANQLENAILNLAVNARDAMPGGGRLVIRTANRRLDSGDIQGQPPVAAGDYVALSIVDSGVGMTAAVLAQAFEPFFTTKGTGSGTGLGLSQVYGFVNQSGGHIDIQSAPGEGTTVTIHLPRLDEAEAGIDTVPEATVAPPGSHSEAILVVEDDPDVRSHSSGILRELGYRVFEAHDGESALAILAEEPGIRLLFTDVGLPGSRNGRQLAEAAQARHPQLGVLFTTAYARDAIVHDGRLQPGVAVLAKPFTFAALAARVREALDRAAHQPRILVVEDEALVRMLAIDLLEELGCRVEPAATAGEALAKLRAAPESFAAAVVDFGLPDRSGDQLVADFMTVRADLPVVVASGYAEADIRQKLPANPHLRVIGKPYDRTQLAQALSGLGL